MKKRQAIMLCIVLVVTMLAAGCGNVKTTMSYTFKVETGDNITLALDTTDGYSISSKVPFVISKDKEELSQGTFIAAEYFDQYVDSVEKDEKAKILDKGDIENCSYVMWNYNDSEYNYVIKINGTKTGILIGNIISEESAKECFRRLKIEAKG